MYYIFQEMFVCGVLFFLLVTNGKSCWHSGAPLLFFCWGLVMTIILPLLFSF